MMEDPLIKLTIKSAPLLLRHYLPGSSVVFITPQKKERSYHIPSSIKGELLEEYKNTQDWIYKNQQIVSKHKQLGNHAKDIAPYAQLVDIKIHTRKQLLCKTAQKFIDSDDQYFKNLAQSLKSACGEPIKDSKITEIVDDVVKQHIPTDQAGIDLVGYQPETETELIIDVLQGDSWLSFEEASKTVDKMKYKEKNRLLKEAMKSGLHLGTKYDFEAITEPFTVHRLSQNNEVEVRSVQIPSPYYGYDINLEEDNETISELMERSYDLSYKLYSMLQDFGGNELAQLAVLNGHRQRYIFSTDHQRISSSDDKIMQLASEKVSLIHPTLFE